jgi:DNA-binding beta-propeller fold protein YncE
LYLIDPAGTVPTKAVDLGNTGEGALSNPWGNYLYSANRLGGSTVQVFDLKQKKAFEISLPLWPRFLHIDEPSKRLLVVSHLGTSVTPIDIDPTSATFHQPLASIDLLPTRNVTEAMGSFAVDLSNRLLFVSHPEQLKISVVDLKQSSVIKTIDLTALAGTTFSGSGQLQLAYLGSKKTLVVYASNAGKIVTYDGTTYSQTSLVDVLGQIKLDPGSFRTDILYADEVHGLVWIGPHTFNPTNGAIADPLPKVPRALAQRVLHYDETFKHYVVAALGVSVDSFALLSANKYQLLHQFDLQTNRLIALELNFQPALRRIHVSVPNRSEVHLINY